jgi:hypothetical protein
MLRHLSVDRARAAVTIVLLMLLLLPALVAIAVGHPTLARSLMAGAVIALPATLRVGPRAGLLAAMIGAACAAFAAVLPPFVPVIALWMAAVGFIAGMATGRGRQPLLMTAPVAVAFVLCTAATSADPLAWIPAVVALLAGGAWMALGAAWIVRGRPTTPVVIVPEPVAVRYAIALAIALGIAGWLVAATGDGHGYWLVSAIVAVFSPDPARSRAAAAERVLLTIGGAAAGILLVQAGLPPGVLVTVASLAAGCAVYLLLGRVRTGRAWLTLAIVCVGGSLDGALGLALVRVLATAGAGLLVVVAAALVPVVSPDDEPAPPSPATPPA